MPKMINMKRKPREKKEDEAVLSDSHEPDYPWGLRLHLNDEEIDKLDMGLPKVGTTMLTMARVEVVSVSDYASRDQDGRSQSVELQITDMAFEEDQPEKTVAERLYKEEA